MVFLLLELCERALTRWHLLCVATLQQTQSTFLLQRVTDEGSGMVHDCTGLEFSQWDKQLEGASQMKCPLIPSSWLIILCKCNLLSSLLCWLTRVFPMGHSRVLHMPEAPSAPSLPQEQKKGYVGTGCQRAQRSHTSVKGHHSCGWLWQDKNLRN